MSIVQRIAGYFRARTWLWVWLIIFAVSLLILGVTGNLHTQGTGSVTPIDPPGPADPKHAPGGPQAADVGGGRGPGPGVRGRRCD